MDGRVVVGIPISWLPSRVVALLAGQSNTSINNNNNLSSVDRFIPFPRAFFYERGSSVRVHNLASRRGSKTKIAYLYGTRVDAATPSTFALTMPKGEMKVSAAVGLNLLLHVRLNHHYYCYHCYYHSRGDSFFFFFFFF
jgi:hypothetical protein